MKFIAAAAFSVLSIATAAVKADYDCPLCPIMEWQHTDPTTGDIYYYYTYYCDFYKDKCDDQPEGCSEITGMYPWPCAACGEGCAGADGPKAPTPPSGPATPAPAHKPFPGLEQPVNAAHPHQMPRTGGGDLARQIGPAKFVKILIPGESSARSAYEYRYKVISKHVEAGVTRRDIWLALETDDPPPMSYPTYTADESDPHGAHWYMVDTGDVVARTPKILLFLME